MRWRASALAAAACAAAALAPVPARAQAGLVRAIDLEQQGRYTEAAEAYRAVLMREPANLAALLGAERTYGETGWRDSTVALARRALAVDSTNRTIHLVVLRSLRALRNDTAAAAAFERWVALAPRDPGPYQEQARLLAAEGRGAEARAVIQRARSRLGDPTACAAELAQVEMREGNYLRAAEEWRAATAREPRALDAASYSLQATPPADRERLLRELTGSRQGEAGRRLAVDMLLGWNEPRRAWEMARGSLPDSLGRRAEALRWFVQRAGRADGLEARRVVGEALELLAAQQTGAEAAGIRVESARAFAEAGDRAAARRMLRAIADAPGAPPAVVGAARATLIDVAAAEGNVAEAVRLLEADRSRLPVRDVLRLSRRVAFALVRAGELDRAVAAVAGDSSLGGEEVRGWVAVYRGDLRGGAATLRAVGADAGDPARAADRAAAVALAALAGRDSLPELGAALLRVAQGDTAGGGHALAAVGRRLGGDAEPEAMLWAARLAESARDSAAAEALWGEIAQRFAVTPAGAVSQLALARLAAARGQYSAAAARLEELILRNPGSALVPEARRELDRVRGLVPRT